MRIDETDLRLALTAKRNAVGAARAQSFRRSQMNGDTPNCSNGWVSGQRYEQAKAALDTAKAQLAAAEAEARVAENEATYSVLVADADGTVVETLVNRGRSSPRARPWFGLLTPARARRSSPFPKRSGRRSARWPRRGTTATINAARPHGCGNSQTPPMPRHGPTKLDTYLTVRPPQHRSARR